jgi:pimeloyl-ACP methyl ester carboxylesterase
MTRGHSRPISEDGASDRYGRSDQKPGARDPRAELLAGLPVHESMYSLSGVSTAVLEGGEGPPIVFLHGPGEYGAKWIEVLTRFAATHRVIAPDLPGHGASVPTGEPLDAHRTIAWLEQLVDRTCEQAPVVVGQILGGAIAARFAARHADRLSKLVLVDSLGLAPFEPAPEFMAALTEYVMRPSSDTHDGMWRRCAFDLDRMQARLGGTWERLKAYNLDRAEDARLSAQQEKLMQEFGIPAIPSAVLESIGVETTLIWGRHDLATRLAVAEATSARYRWPLHVIDRAGDDPPLERPEAFVEALRAALGAEAGSLRAGEMS